MNFINLDSPSHLLWTIPLALVLIFFANLKRTKALAQIINLSSNSLLCTLNPWSRRKRNILLLFAWILLFLAHGRPWFGEKIADTSIASRDIVICLDTSKSMLARDIVPSRLQHAKLWIKQLVEKFPGDRFALVNFAGEAVLECPLTSSSDNFMNYLNNSDTDSILLGGTNIQSALAVAFAAFKGGESNNRAIILISDGDELQGNSTEQLQKLSENNIPIFAVGIGDNAQPGIIEIGEGKILRDKNNQIVVSKLNEKGLMNLAEKTQGVYVRSTTLDSMLKPVLKRVDALEPNSQNISKENLRIERYYLPLSLALIAMLLRFLTSERIKKTALVFLVSLLSTQTFAQDSTPENLIPADVLSQNEKSEHKPIDNSQKIQQIKDEITENQKNQAKLDRLQFLLGALYQQSHDFENAINAYNQISPNASSQIISSVLTNRATIEIDKAAKEIFQNPENALTSLNEATIHMKNAFKNCANTDDKLLSILNNNLQLLLQYRKTAQEVQKVLETLKKSINKTVQDLLQAKEQQTKSLNEKSLTNQISLAEITKQKLASATKNFTLATEILQNAKIPDESKKLLLNTQENISQAVQQVEAQTKPLNFVKRNSFIEKAITHINKALENLGVKPPQQQEQNSQQENQKENQQEQNSQQENQQQQNQNSQNDQSKSQEKKPEEKNNENAKKQENSSDENGESDQKKENNSSQNAENKNDLELSQKQFNQLKDKKDSNTKNYAKESKLDNSQTEAIMQEMQTLENELKQRIKLLKQKQSQRREQNIQNW